MTTGNGHEDVIEQLEDALSADSAEMKNFHVREALQYIEIQDELAEGQTDGGDEPAQTDGAEEPVQTDGADEPVPSTTESTDGTAE